MTKDDIHPLRDLAMLVERFVGAEARENVTRGYERMATASAEEVAQWLKGAMERLDALPDAKARAQIMAQMGLNCAEMNRSHVEKALARRAQFETLEAFLDAEEKEPGQGTRLERDGDLVHQYYTPLSGFGCRCYCSLWRGLLKDENVSLTWCQCSRAFVATVWEGYLGRPGDVELVESCISGAEECRFVIRI